MFHKTSLPIEDLLPSVLEVLSKHQNLILQASPGSGKTTRVPPVLLRVVPEGQEIWVLVPRRLAAKAAARRVAEELGEKVGETVGYQFRFEKVVSAKTRIRFLTEGLFPKLLRQDPTLEKVGAVVVDEFHERHLHTDVALALLKEIQSESRPDLRIVVMSATIEAESLSRYLPSSKALTLESPVHPLEISYLPQVPQARLEDLVFQSLQTIHQKKMAGDVLVFLPGIADIRRCEKALSGKFSNAKILTLYGDLSKEEQDLIFRPTPERKIILSTNIAESSLTIPGVAIVVDGGRHRQARFSHWSGIPALKTRPISQASAIQRAGRAARTGPGVCFRLYTRSDYDSRPAFEKAEILRTDLSQAFLELKGLNRLPLDWFENPPPETSQAAFDLLYELGAFASPSAAGALTDSGRKMASLPLHPRLSRLLLEARKRRCLPEAIRLAALLSEGELSRLDALEDIAKAEAGYETKRLIQSLGSFFPEEESARISPGIPSKNLSLSLLAAFPDRVARQSVRPQGVELVLCLGGSAALRREAAHDPLLHASEYFLVLDVQETDKVFARSLVALEPEWLIDEMNPLFHEEKEVVWARNRVVSKRFMKYGQLILDEEETASENGEEEARCLLTEGLGFPKEGEFDIHVWIRLFGKIVDVEALESLMTRLDLWQRHRASQEKAFEWKSDFLRALATKLVTGCRSLKDLQNNDLPTKIKMEFLNDVSELDRLLPTSFQLPNQRKTKVHYAWGQDPWIASRLQDFFGLKDAPKILNGKLPLTLHLLAPNQRPVQVTKDLASFWKNTYPEMRKELSRRYPRHSWPETIK